MFAIILVAFKTKIKLLFTKHANKLNVRMHKHDKMLKDMRMQLCLRSREKQLILRDKNHHYCETTTN